MDHARLRSWWAHRQGLDGGLTGKSAAEVLEHSGWARSVGGCGPYLTLFSRAGISREAADAAVAGLDIHELPSARGCTYVLPACDFALGLKSAQAFEGGEMKVAEKLGVTAREIDKLCDAVIAALEKGPLDPDGLREATGKAVRNLGAEGQKKGLATTLPVALGRLQTEGEIRRVPVNGRLDQQRYQYTLWRPNPLRGFALSAEEVHVELARRFFAWIAPATVAEFQTFAGLGVKAAKAAVAPLRLEPLAKDDERLMPPADRAAFEAFQPPEGSRLYLDRQPRFHAVAARRPHYSAGCPGSQAGRVLRGTQEPAQPGHPRPRPHRRSVGVRPRRPIDRLASLRQKGPGAGSGRGAHRRLRALAIG